jgi:nucleoside-diphosphate-sugar epimerase
VTAPVVLVGASGWLGGQLSSSLPGHVAVPAREVLDSRGRALAQLSSGPVVIVNAAGLKRGSVGQLRRANAVLVSLLVDAVATTGGHLVHLGSAAEYGLSQPDGLCSESAECAPESDYGRTKLQGTEIAVRSGRATVLRVFNVLSVPPQPGSPLDDIVGRIASGTADGRPVELLSAGTVRDWVPIDFVSKSVAHAVARRPTGVYNVCSGRGVSLGEAAAGACTLLGKNGPVLDLQQFPASRVIGSPDAWEAVSGLRLEADDRDLAQAMADGVARSARL